MQLPLVTAAVAHERFWAGRLGQDTGGRLGLAVSTCHRFRAGPAGRSEWTAAVSGSAAAGDVRRGSSGGPAQRRRHVHRPEQALACLG